MRSHEEVRFKLKERINWETSEGNRKVPDYIIARLRAEIRVLQWMVDNHTKEAIEAMYKRVKKEVDNYGFRDYRVDQLREIEWALEVPRDKEYRVR